MRLFKRLLVIFFILLLAYIAHILISTGFFRNINPYFDGQVLQKVSIKGAEDMMLSYSDSFLLVSATSRLIHPPQAEEKGGLYLIDLKTDDFIPISLTEHFNQSFAPHGLSFYPKDSTYRVMAISHTPQGHSIEVFDLFGKSMRHHKTLSHSSMISPNDLVMLDEDRFYFTNDHKYTAGMGKIIEEYLGLAVSNVVYFDGQEYREVANGIAYANGINIDRKRNLVYVASPRHFLVKVYQMGKDGGLQFIEDIPCKTGVDNIELDKAGNLWIGCHPNLLRFGAYAKGKKKTTPSEIIKISYRKKGDYTIEQVYVEDGSTMSGSTVAVPFGDLIFVGNVMDNAFLVLESNNSKTAK